MVSTALGITMTTYAILYDYMTIWLQYSTTTTNIRLQYYTLTADTVRPALVDPIPVVSTALGITFDAYLRNWDFPVPGSPTRSRCDSPRTRVPLSSIRCKRYIPDVSLFSLKCICIHPKKNDYGGISMVRTGPGHRQEADVIWPSPWYQYHQYGKKDMIQMWVF